MPERNQFMYPTFGWFGGDERTQFKEYLKQGGGLGFNAWLRQGKPSPPTALSVYGAGRLTPEQLMGTTVAPVTPGETVSIAKRQAQQALGQVGGRTIGGEKIPPPNGIVSYYDAQGNNMVWNGMDKYIPAGFDPTKVYQPPEAIAPYQQAQLTYQQQQDAQAQANWQEQQAWQQQQVAQQQDWQQQQLEQEQQQQQQQLGWYRQQAQMQQAEQERQYRSQLAASPMSWLQYSSYTGENPVIQPWMLPLMPQQYAGTTAGEKLPGWQAGGSMTALPGLTTPSAQYWGRMGPTAQQQYIGYQQAQGGINPMETQFRLQSQAPPGGRNYGLTWGR